MHPELLSALALAQNRELATRPPAAGRPSPADAPEAPERARRRALPRFHVTWTRTTLAAVADRRRARSLVIVISATRTW
jgi:hypothetical protein